MIGEANDILDANRTSALDYFQAQQLVQKRHHADQLVIGREPKSYTVALPEALRGGLKARME